MRSGMVSASRPDGLTRPKSTSAGAPPPAWPSSQPSTTAGTCASQGAVRRTPPFDKITTVRGLAAATCRISSWWAGQRSMPAASAPSVSCRLPTNTSAVSLARASATAAAAVGPGDPFLGRALGDQVAGREADLRLGQGRDPGEGVVQPGGGDLRAAAALVARGARELADDGE